MSQVLTLSNEQKAQVRNAFTIIDSHSKDGAICASDLVNVYKTLGVEVPSEAELKSMLNGQELISFAQFSRILATELGMLDSKAVIADALRAFTTEENRHNLLIDVGTLKEACCSVQLGDIGSGDNRLSRAAFDSLTAAFVKEQLDGTKMFCASNWLDAYID